MFEDDVLSLLYWFFGCYH